MNGQRASLVVMLVEVSGSLASPFDENPVIGLSAISKVRTDVGIHLPLEPIVEYHTHDQTMMVKGRKSRYLRG